MNLSSTPWKHQETLRFFDVSRRLRKVALGTNGFIFYLVILILYHAIKLFDIYTLAFKEPGG